MITVSEAHVNFKKIFFNLFIFLCICFSSYAYGTDYTISNGTTQTSRVTLTNNDTLTVDAGGEIDYTWPAVDADNRTFPSGTTTITNNGTIEGSCCVVDIRSSTNPKLINNGTINGKTSSRTIYANNSVNAIIINNGDITILEANDYEAIDGDSSSGMTITNNNGATISSAGDDAIAIEGASNVTITNAGTISAGDDWGIQADNANGLTINNSGTISAVDDYAIYLRNADNVSITNSGTITSAEDPINMQSSTGTVSITNSGTISQTGGGYNDGLTLQDNATFTNTGSLTASRYAIGGSSSGVTIVNKGTITGGTYDFYVPSMTITTLTNGQGGIDALVYRGKMPTNYKLFVASTSSYGKFAKEWGTSGTTTFSIDTASTLAANTYTDVFTNTTSARFAGGLTGTCVCSNGVFTWTLSDSNSDNKWDLAIAADTTKPTTTFSPVNGATSVAVASDITLTFNEAVRLTNDSALDDSNVDALITLKENNSSGSDIAFDATINNDKTVITINPSSSLSSQQVVYIAIGTSVEDASNNAINAANASFTTADVASPTLSSSSPTDNATGISESANVVLTFNEAVDRESGNITIKKTSDNSTIETIGVTDSKITGTGTTQITINPAATLASLTEYYVLIDATAFDDSSSNSYAGISSTTALSFTTGDTTNPTLSSSSPADNATAVGVNANVVLTFNEAVDPESGNITIKKTSDNSTIETIGVTDSKITGTGTTQITINPAATLASLTEYYVLIDATAFDDAAGNSFVGISSTTALSFTTADVGAPILSSSSPADNATGIGVNDNIILNFDEAVDRESGNITIKKTSDNSTIETIGVTDSKITGTGTTQITINPAATLASLTEYYVLIDATAFDDSSSNSYAGISSTTALSFTTLDIVNPTLSSSTPTDNATGFGVNDNIILNFDEAVDAESGNITIKKSFDNSTVETIGVSGGLVSGSGSTQITINPSTTLASSTGYYINIDATAFDDASGNSYAGISNSTSLNFAAGDTAAPLLSSSSPSDNATGVSENANIILTFNEAVDIESGNITIKKASDSSTIETISVSGGLVSGSGSTQITINPSTTLASSTGYYINIDATAFDDASSNSYSGISNTTSLNFETGDNFNPILISSSPKTGEKGVDNSPSIILTFDEPVFFGSGNITVKNLKDNSTVETISVNGNQVQGYGPTEIKIDVLTLLEHLNSYYINIDSTAFHDSDNNYYAGISDSTTLHFEIKPTLSPLLKPMVISTIQSSNAIVSGWADFSINNAFSRITWLSMNEGSNKTSHQGIQLRFQDEVIDVFINTPANDNNYDESYLANKISNAIQNTNGTFVAVSDQIKTDAEEIFYNETARLREAVIGNLNPTFEPVMDGWSMWTDGKIIIGKKDGTLKSAKQEFDSQALSLGFDKPMNNDGLIGFVIEIGQNNIDIGDDATNVKSDNYSLSNYSVFRVNRNLKLESVVGIGIFIMDTVRTDGLQKLTGSRRSDQRFFSTRLINDNIYNLGNWKTRPYIMHSRAVSDLGGFSETGGSLALTFNDQKVKDYSAGIGVDLQTEITINNNSIKPFTKLEYNRSSSKTSATMYYNKEGPQYSYTSNSNKANTNWKFKFGSDLRTESGWNGSASFTREQPVRSGEDYQYSNIFSVNLGKRF